MKHRITFAALGLLSTLIAARTAQAGDWHDGMPGQRQAGPAEPASRAYLTQYQDALALRGIDLVVDRASTTHGFSTVRYAQLYSGLPVFGKVVAVRLDDAGRVTKVMVEVARDLSVSPVPTVSKASAIATVASLGMHVPGPDTQAELGVMPVRGRPGMLVWRVNVLGPRGMFRYVIDAHGGGLVNMVSLAMNAKGNVYDINAEKGPVVQRDLPNLTTLDPQRLTGRAGTIVAYVSGDVSGQDPFSVVTEQKAAPDANGDFLYQPATSEPDFTDSFAEVNIYYHLDRMDTYFRDKLGLKMGYSLMGVANYGPNQDPYDNAFYTEWQGTFKNAIFIGQGSWSDFAYDSDVFLHEFTHYVNSNAVGFSNGPIDFDELGVVTMPGAINEGSADYFSCTVNDDPIVGESSLGQYARDLEGPSGKCPANMSGESHEDGKMIGTAGWAIRDALGKDLADPIFWGGINMLYQGASFDDLATGVISMAQSYQKKGTLTTAQVDQVKAAFDKRGMVGCSRILELTTAKPIKSSLMGLSFVGELFGGYGCSQMKQFLSLSSTFQFRYTPKPEDKGAKFSVDLGAGGTLKWGIFVRANDSVIFSGGQGEQFAPSVFDYSIKNISADNGALVIDDKSDPPFDPSATYTMVIGHQNCPSGSATVSVEALTATGPDAGPEAGPDAPLPVDAGKDSTAPKPDSGVKSDAGNPPPMAIDDGVEAGGGACSCRTAGRTSSATGALSLLAMALLLRRRRSA
ncbi:MAG: hypothetical protein HY898_16195 [Deltaproteobacteria bacterium]|nr:hypothetical protein [Deltaproteobacteria bacterium]